MGDCCQKLMRESEKWQGEIDQYIKDTVKRNNFLCSVV